MKKIIDGARYNTDTAKLIGRIEPAGYDHSNFSYFCEELYKSKAGKYFLFGEGHGNSRYGVWHGNQGGWGEKIMPFTFEEAKDWAEQLTVEEYEAEFGDPGEAGDDPVTLTVSVPMTVKAKIEQIRSESGKSFSQIVIELINSL